MYVYLGVFVILLLLLGYSCRRFEMFSSLSYQDKRDLVYCDYRPFDYGPGECQMIKSRIYKKRHPIRIGVMIAEGTEGQNKIVWEQLDPITKKYRYLTNEDGIWMKLKDVPLQIAEGDRLTFDNEPYRFVRHERLYLPPDTQYHGYLIRVQKIKKSKIPRVYKVYSVRTKNNRRQLVVKRHRIHFPLPIFDENTTLSYGDKLKIHGVEYRFHPFSLF